MGTALARRGSTVRPRVNSQVGRFISVVWLPARESLTLSKRFGATSMSSERAVPRPLPRCRPSLVAAIS
jgi:hypothetical protein